MKTITSLLIATALSLTTSTAMAQCRGSVCQLKLRYLPGSKPAVYQYKIPQVPVYRLQRGMTYVPPRMSFYMGKWQRDAYLRQYRAAMRKRDKEMQERMDQLLEDVGES